ncbi:MAG: two-component system sensor histidine kinase NtrB [Pseudomonadota bacterium]
MRQLLNSLSPKVIQTMTMIAVLFFSIIYVILIYPDPISVLFSLGIFAIAFVGYGLHKLMSAEPVSDDISGFILDDIIAAGSLMDSISDGIVVVDVNGKIKRANSGLCNIIGIERERLLGKDICYLSDNRHKSSRNNLLHDIILESLEIHSEIREFEMTYERNCDLLNISVSTYILENKSKKTIGILAIVHNLTQERRLEQNLIRAEKLANAGQMAAELAHEIKNPICSIKGLLQIMGRKYELTDNKYYEVINDELERISIMLKKFLALTHSEPKLESTCVNSLMEGILPLLESYAEAKDVDIDVKVHGKIPYIHADSENLRQVFVNIVQNGIDALPQKGRINISIMHDKVKDMLRIEFKDNGSGVKPEILDKIFDPFFTTKQNGSGLGLAISHKIIQDHKGRLSARNNPEGGATFEIELPVQKAS